jgi:hypothetical protein
MRLRGAVLGAHRIADFPADPQGMKRPERAIDADVFAIPDNKFPRLAYVTPTQVVVRRVMWL